MLYYTIDEHFLGGSKPAWLLQSHAKLSVLLSGSRVILAVSIGNFKQSQWHTAAAATQAFRHQLFACVCLLVLLQSCCTGWREPGTGPPALSSSTALHLA